MIKCSMANIFVEKSYTKCGGKLFLDYFFKILKMEHISGSTVQNFVLFVFVLYEVKNMEIS